MRRALPLLVALSSLSAGGCARDLELPGSVPPRVDAVHLVGLESAAPAAGGRPVLGGELVALSGGGFPLDRAQLRVTIGGAEAEVLDGTATRLVARVPTLVGTGPVDVTVTTPAGLRTAAGALRYDGPGQPLGFGSVDLDVTVPAGGVVPVEPAGPTGFADLAVAYGASDSALLVFPSLGIAATSIPLGLVPVSAAARLTAAPLPNPDGDFLVEVLALDRAGTVGLGRLRVSSEGEIVERFSRTTLASTISVGACTGPQVLFTRRGTPVAAWVRPDGGSRIASIDLSLGQYGPKDGIVFDTGAPVTGWSAWKDDRVVFAAGAGLFAYDAATQVAPVPLTAGLASTPVTDLLAAGCGAAVQEVTTVAAVAAGAAEALAVSYRAGGLERVALVDLVTGAVRRGLVAFPASALALVPEPPYAPLSWRVLAASAGNLLRFTPQLSAPACGEELAPDANFPLSDEPLDFLPTFGALAVFNAGTRVLTTTPAGELLTVLPPTMTSPGPVFRFAAYAGLSMNVAGIEGASLPIAVAEHAYLGAGGAGLDTGSAQLVLSLEAGGAPVALGGSGYGRGAVWLAPALGGALAYTGDVPAAGRADLQRGGSAAVTRFALDLCGSGGAVVAGSKPVAGGPDLLTQGPARAGALGPDGVTRHGPASPPVYSLSGTVLEVWGADQAACLADPGLLGWAGCTPAGTVDLGFEPVDLTFSAGDATVALRLLDEAACACEAPFTCPCAADDAVCRRASCPVAPALLLASGGAAVPLLLPTPPAGLAPDPGGGFLVTLPCEPSLSASPSGRCFETSPLCDGLPAATRGSGALLHVPEDGAEPTCLAVLPALGGPVAVTPNAAEAWTIGLAADGSTLLLTRLALPRSTADGRIDGTARAERVAAEVLGAGLAQRGAFPVAGLAFTPDGATGIATVPGEFRIVLFE